MPKKEVKQKTVTWFLFKEADSTRLFTVIDAPVEDIWNAWAFIFQRTTHDNVLIKMYIPSMHLINAETHYYTDELPELDKSRIWTVEISFRAFPIGNGPRVI